MKVIDVRNVNQAFMWGVDLFNSDVNYREQDSRNGATREILTPVTTVYSHPWQRVLFREERDANPFFHLYEAIWMLGGSRNLMKLTHFNSGMSAFSDDNETLNGSYGYRWRKQFDYDQLWHVVDMLKRDPDSRRVVLQMWDAVHDLDSPSKYIPCNTNIYFKIRGGELQMTVCNRSNDMIWGAYGANAVHMSVLQEYVAAALGIYIGPYYQVSDSFHVYLNKEWDKVKNLSVTPFLPVSEFYPEKHYPLCSNPETFLEECESLIETIPPRRVSGNPEPVDVWPTMWKEHDYQNTFFPEVMIPMIKAYLCHKERKYEDCYSHLANIEAEDWQFACLQWIKRREANWRKKNGT